ncbi:fibronectin type III-like domain-contianing protein [Cupriavidus necator]|nr:fibronectin type III-like domain-contianing protein [Cupriavidus necator]
MSVTFTVTNTGSREGDDVPQVYLTEAAGERRMRLLGFERVSLRPGESARISLTADPRLLARFQSSSGHWRIEAGAYCVALGRSASELALCAETTLVARELGR